MRGKGWDWEQSIWHLFYPKRLGNLNIKPNFNNQQPGFSNLQSSFNNPQPSFNNLQSGFNNLQPGYSNLQPNLNNLQSFPGLEARPGNCEHNYDRNGADE